MTESFVCASALFAEAAAFFSSATRAGTSFCPMTTSVAVRISTPSLYPLFSRVSGSYSFMLSISSPKKSMRQGFSPLTAKTSKISPRREKRPSESQISSRTYPIFTSSSTTFCGAISCPFFKESTESRAGKSCRSASNVVTAARAPFFMSYSPLSLLKSECLDSALL